MVWLTDGEISLSEDTFSRIDRIVADEARTDRRTTCHGYVRAMHMHRVVKINFVV